MIEIPVPKIIAKGKGEFEYLVLTYFEGKDIGLVYSHLSDVDKRKNAKEIVHIQNQVAALRLENMGPQWSWRSSIDTRSNGTNMALLNMECDTDYVKYILDEMRLSDIQKKAFLFYTLMFCVDFMGERGMHFMDKFVEVNKQIIDRLNGLYDSLWAEWNICRIE